MNRLFLLGAVLTAFFLIGCDDSPTEPVVKLQARFTGTFSPAVFDELGNITSECVVEITAQPAAGTMPYAFLWQMPWIRSALVVEGYPSEAGVVLVLPPTFGSGGLFTVRLKVTDAADEVATASAERRFDCAVSDGFTFQGF